MKASFSNKSQGFSEEVIQFIFKFTKCFMMDWLWWKFRLNVAMTGWLVVSLNFPKQVFRLSRISIQNKKSIHTHFTRLLLTYSLEKKISFGWIWFVCQYATLKEGIFWNSSPFVEPQDLLIMRRVLKLQWHYLYLLRGVWCLDYPNNVAFPPFFKGTGLKFIHAGVWKM